MVVVKKRFSIPEYKEKKEIYEAMNFKEKKIVEKDSHCFVFFAIDDTDKHYEELRKLEKDIYRKGPPFFPIILLVVGAFVFLSIFVILLAISIKDGSNFLLLQNCLLYLVPAFLCLTATVIYTYFYFSINKKIIEKGKTSKEEILAMAKKIKEK